MRSRPEIERDTKGYDRLALEVLLDIRALLQPVKPKRAYRRKKASGGLA